MNDATKEFAAIWSHAHVENHWHRMFHLLSLLAMGGLGYVTYLGWTRPVERIYITSDATGRAQAVRPETLANMPSDANLKYFLTQFVHLHFARRKATVATELPRSLYYLDGALVSKIRTEWEVTDLMKKVATGTVDKDVQVDQVVLRQTQKLPYEAEVDYTVLTIDSASRAVLDRKSYTATIRYVLAQEIANSVVPHNPIGLMITYFRSDESFRREP
jgi:type IV secretory pathway TrbF-like protein